MKRYKLISIALLIISVYGCGNDSQEYISHISGYWEIKQVKKGNNLIKEYTISTTIDYFEVSEDLTGYRKKVAPTLNGTYNITKDQAPFVLKIENDSLNIYYNVNDVITKETIIKANPEELIITNSQNLKYIYKPFKSITIE